MALLDQIFQINISSASAAPSRPGFGTTLLLSYHTAWTDRVRVYSSPAAMVSDGFATTHPAYVWASAYFAQNPAPQKLKIGRRTTAPTQTNDLGIKASPPTGAVISFTLGGVTFTHTTSAGETAAQAATAIASVVSGALPTNVASATVTNTTHVSFASTAGKLVNFIVTTPTYATSYHNVPETSGGATAADLTAIAAADNDWYALAIDSCSDAEAEAAAAWVESAKKIFAPRSSDSSVIDGTSTTDLAYTLKNSAYGRTGVWFNRAGGTLSNIDAGILGSRMTADPGSDTWAFKTLATVPADTLTDSEIQALQNKNASFYVTAANVNFTNGGKVASGEWFDVVRGLDWMRSELQILQYSLALNRPKIPFTDLGIDMIKGVVRAALIEGVNAGLFAASPAPTVTAPAAADVSAADKAARNLPGVVWTATLAGAIHSTVVSGTVSV